MRGRGLHRTEFVILYSKQRLLATLSVAHDDEPVNKSIVRVNSPLSSRKR